MKALIGAFNQEKALVGAFSVIVLVHIIHNIVLCPILSSITSPDLLSTKQINFKPVAGCRWPYRSRELETRDWSSVPGPDAAKHRKQQTWRESRATHVDQENIKISL